MFTATPMWIVLLEDDLAGGRVQAAVDPRMGLERRRHGLEREHGEREAARRARRSRPCASGGRPRAGSRPPCPGCSRGGSATRTALIWRAVARRMERKGTRSTGPQRGEVRAAPAATVGVGAGAFRSAGCGRGAGGAGGGTSPLPPFGKGAHVIGGHQPGGAAAGHPRQVHAELARQAAGRRRGRHRALAARAGAGGAGGARLPARLPPLGRLRAVRRPARRFPGVVEGHQHLPDLDRVAGLDPDLGHRAGVRATGSPPRPCRFPPPG